MTQEASVPPDLFEKLRQLWMQDIANAQRAASIRNASISSGGTFSITGGAFVFKADDGTALYYLGPVLPTQLDGSAQPGLLIRRADNTIAMAMYDAAPGVGGTLQQALNWFDRQGNVVLADDTNSGQGMARPYVPFAFYAARNGDWPSTSSATFDTLYRAKGPKQQPRLFVRAWAVCTTAGATGELRVMVNGVQLGSTPTVASGTVNEFFFGPAAIAGGHMDDLGIEIQARVVSGGGTVQVGASSVTGYQS